MARAPRDDDWITGERVFGLFACTTPFAAGFAAWGVAADELQPWAIGCLVGLACAGFMAFLALMVVDVCNRIKTASLAIVSGVEVTLDSKFLTGRRGSFREAGPHS